GAGGVRGSLAHQVQDLAVLVGRVARPLRPAGGSHGPVAVDVAAHLAQDGAAALVAEEAGERVMEVATELEEPLWMFAEEDHLLDHPIEAIELLRGDGAGDLLDDGLLDDGAEPEE